MQRISTPTAVQNKFGPGKTGWTDGVPGISPATDMTADWFDHVQEEIANVIEAAGIPLSAGNRAQMLAALDQMFIGASKKATDIALGAVELATSAEVIAGIDGERAVTPVGLAALLATFSPGNNPIKLPGGLMLQIGGPADPADFPGGINRFSVTFPTAFPNAVLYIDTQIKEAADAGTAGSTVTSAYRDPTRFGFTFVATEYTGLVQSMYYRWLAIGY